MGELLEDIGIRPVDLEPFRARGPRPSWSCTNCSRMHPPASSWSMVFLGAGTVAPRLRMVVCTTCATSVADRLWQDQNRRHDPTARGRPQRSPTRGGAPRTAASEDDRSPA